MPSPVYETTLDAGADAPITPGHTSQATTSMRWTWASGGAQNDYVYSTVSDCSSGYTYTSNTYYDDSGLSANTAYTRYACARNGDGATSTALTIGPFYTSASTSSNPIVNNPATSTLDVNPVTGGAESSMAIYVEAGAGCDGSGGLGYVQADGSTDVSAIWQTDGVWATVTAIGLSVNTQYSFCVKARNGNDDETGFGSASSAYTSANTPSSPVVDNPGSYTLDVNPTTGGAETSLAIYIEAGATCDGASGLGYVQAAGNIA